MFINNLFNNFQNIKKKQNLHKKTLILAVFLLLMTSFLAGVWIYNGSILDNVLALLYSVVSVACLIIIIAFYKQAKINYFYALLNTALMGIMLILFFTVSISYDLSIYEDINPLWMTLALVISVTIGLCLYFIVFKHKHANVVMSNKSRAIIAIASGSAAGFAIWSRRSGLIEGGIKHLFYFGLIPLLIITFSVVIIHYLMLFQYRQQLLAMEQQYYYNNNSYNINQQ